MNPLACTAVGSPDAPPLVLLHGWLGDGHDWAGVLPALTGRFRCIVMDLPGHGASPEADPGGLEAAAAALWSTLDALGIGQAALAGYSMGGRLALHAALARPRRCVALAMLAATPGLASEPERTARAEADTSLAAKLVHEGLPRFLTHWYAQPLFSGLATLQALDLRALLARRAKGDAASLAAALHYLSVGRQASLWPALPDLSMPSLWVAGTTDLNYLALARQAATAAPRGKLALVASCSHALLLEAPEQVSTQLIGLMEATAQAATP